MKINCYSRVVFVAVVLSFFLCGVSHAASKNDAIASVQKLISDVQQMNLDSELANTLLSKLNDALDSLTSTSASKRQDAVDDLNTFTNEVNAQCGKKITSHQCNLLLPEAAQAIEYCKQMAGPKNRGWRFGGSKGGGGR